MTIANWLVTAKTRLHTVDIPSAQLDSELLLSYALKQTRTWLLAHGEETLSAKDTQKANKLLARRLKREPLAYIRGWQEFYGRRFSVTPTVLIPRPESETIISLLKELHPRGNLVDIGTGSGTLAITLALEIPELEVTASDVSTAALLVAQKNTKQLAPNIPIVFKQSDLLASLSESFDVIVANLPYVSKNWDRSPETNFEPSTALYADDNGLALIYRLIQETTKKLRKDGLLVLEADPRQFDAIIVFASSYHLTLMKREGFTLVFVKA